MRKLVLVLFFHCFILTTIAQVQTGKASFYADKFEGSHTASGEKYRHHKLTGAHKSLPFGTKVKVTNLSNNQFVELTINDRGPYVDGRIIDVSKAAAEKLGFLNQGIADVSIEVIDAGDGKSKELSRPIEQVSVDEKEFYSFEIDRISNPKGYGVQIGTYQELVNLMRLSDNLKHSYKKNVTVQVKVVKGVKYYGLILGNFSNRAKAEAFRDDLKKKFPDAFIVEFDRM
jgi:rare lipoprotein A